MKVFFTVIFITFLAACAQQGPKINYEYNPTINVLTASTFTWLKEDKALNLPVGFNPIAKIKIEEAIKNEMITKGYRFVNNVNVADLAISYSVGSRDKVRVDSYPTAYQNGFVWGARYYGGYSRYSNAINNTKTVVRQYTQGELAVDIYDVKTKQPAWHGWATQKISTKDKTNIDSVINTAVTQLLKNFN